uniref:Retrotransposon gag domain-containing protein n=1 Tax=Cajanus cajan TaxID=3821 RepID=A0A151QMP1_CAJCA|nr:hypothetical protein KK1_048051 [Cajanus cajan]
MNDNSLALGDHYQQPPRRVHRTPKTREYRVNLPYFHGKDDVEGYLDWEMKVEQIFTCHQVSEERKVPLATLSFQGHAMYWWASLVRDRRLHNDPSIQHWNELRSSLRRRHIPSYYTRELINKLQRLHQKNMTVEDTKSSAIQCFKFLGRGHIVSQCPNKKVMILRGQDIYSSQDEATTSSSSSEDEEEASEGESCEVTYPYNGELLMMRRVLNNQPSDTQSQRENIFHTRCNISNKACSLIVDSGSWCNCCSTRMVEK